MDIANLTFELLLFLFGAATIAGFLDTLAGGGGLITLPALVLSGIPPLFALGTNKLQGTAGTATAAMYMLRTRTVHWDDVKLLMAAAFIGSAVGTFVVQIIDTEILNFVIPLSLLIIAMYFLINPQPKKGKPKLIISDKKYSQAVIPAIGFYDGMFGPGTGSFFALAGVSLKGKNIIQATAVAKTLNFSTNFSSLFIFLVLGKIAWATGLIMMVGQFIGAWLGSMCLLKINPIYLRGIVVTMCLGMLIKYCISMGWFG